MRGGPRPGAGRPAGSNRTNQTESLLVRLPAHLKQKAARIGAGNASAGVRLALETHPEPKQ